MAEDKVWIFNNCTPLVQAGKDIVIKPEQTLKKDGTKVLHMSGPDAVNFVVDGPRLQLTPDDIAGVYPAPDSTSSPDVFFPHIALNRRTLPWERELEPGRPWLALILLTEKELRGSDAMPPAGTLRHLTVGELAKLDPGTHSHLPNDLKLASDTDLHMAFVPAATLEKVLPKPEELRLLCHMKRVRTNNIDKDTAVVIGNRLPTVGKTGDKADLHTALLVSLERDYVYKRMEDLKKDGTSKRGGKGSRQRTKEKRIGLIVLHHWTFRPSLGGDFEQVMQAISIRPNGGVLRFGNLPQELPKGVQATLSGGFPAVLDDFGFPLDPLQHNQATPKAKYRGPLRPFPAPPRSKGFAVRAVPEEFSEPGGPAEADYSHAAAFELGRLLAINGSAIRDDMYGGIKWDISMDRPVPQAINSMPVALQRPDWPVNEPMNPDAKVHWPSQPWRVGVDPLQKAPLEKDSLVKNRAQLLDLAGQGDPGGVAEQLEGLKQPVLDHLAQLAAPGPEAVDQMDIDQVTPQALAARFSAMKNVGS
ncbi:MAG TPA: hypothetical protein VGR26_08490 [Acidimicrobiales bacterium]|nr:hypothetical protein [Acidimicrobiales bacterium]